MNKNRLGWFNVIGMAAMITALIAPARSSPIAASAGLDGRTRVVVDAAQPELLSSLQAAGSQILADYGNFRLVELPPGAPIPEGARFVEDVIHLRGFDLDTRAPDTSNLAPQLLQNTAPGGEGFWMVQFAGPIQDDWLSGLRAQGLEIVAYMPENGYVVWGEQPDQRVLKAAEANPLLSWQGSYQPAYRLDERLRTLALDPASIPSAEVTIQLYRTKHTADTIAQLTALAEDVLRPATDVLQYTNLSLRLPSSSLVEVAGLADVFNIETYGRPVLMDEAQGQILAGNLTTSGSNIIPSGPGYLAWLASKGFPTTPSSYPIVDVTDDGIDQGLANNVLHPDFFEQGSKTNPDRIVYLNNCTPDTYPDGLAGHGNLNAGIMAGFNNLTGVYTFEDPLGYNYGLGISPYGRIAGTKIFSNSGPFDLSQCGWNYGHVVQDAYNAGARITSNSWGNSDSPGAYTTDSQAYDALTRDAASAAGGNQSMLHIFSAGNSGSSPYTVTSPGTAKNVLTVGATENVREQGVSDNCVTDGDNADDIAYFSSRGPTNDLRAKPDIMAPGTHIQGQASQDPGYNAAGVCGPKYYPAGQIYYTWSSGTSHSAPAVAGAAQLAYEYYGRMINPGMTPSPAMLKALLLNSPRYLTGLSANGILPTPDQGWGDVDLGRLFDGIPRQVIDQSIIFNNTGNSVTYQWQVVDPTKPVRATLVWTDAPGSTSGAAYVNNLDLEVTSGSQVYRGNVFSGAYSLTGGLFDTRNNVENVFLPAGQGGSLTVKVTAENIAGNGLPGIGDSTDQDFALVVYNAAPLSPLMGAVEISAVNWNDSLGNNNGVIDIGERLVLSIDLHNKGATSITGINAVLSPLGASSIPQPNSKYSDIPSGQTRSSLTDFIVDVDSGISCGGSLNLFVNLTSTAGSGVLTLPGLSVGANNTYSASGVPANIPDNNPSGVSVPITIADHYFINDVDVKINAIHTYDEDLVFTLIPPSGSPVLLINKRGSSGENFQDTILDDEAATAIADGNAPFTGSYQPELPLSSLDSSNVNGIWNLNVADTFVFDTGSMTGFDLIISSCGVVDVSVLPASNLRSGIKGISVTHALTVKNTGSNTDTFTVNLSGATWTTTPSNVTVGPLLGGASAQLTVTVQIPPNPPVGSDQVVVTLISQSDSASRQSAVLITNSEIVFLPFVKK